MPAIADHAEKLLLDFLFGGAAAVAPSTRAVALSLGTPNASAGSEIGTGSGYARQTCTFAAAASPAGSTDNANAMTFGPFSSNVTVPGVFIADDLGTAGNMLWYGALATARSALAGDYIIFNANALVITLT